jgi:hypothetical protein
MGQTSTRYSAAGVLSCQDAELLRLLSQGLI